MKAKGPGFGLLIFIVIMLLGFGVCAAVCNDNDDDDSAPVLVERKHKHDAGDDRDYSGDRDTGRNSRGKCENADYCDDRDGSPTFRDSPVTICLPNSTCNWGGDQSAGQQAMLDPRCIPYHCDPQPEGDRHV